MTQEFPVTDKDSPALCLDKVAALFCSVILLATFDPILISGRGFALQLYDVSIFSLMDWACSSAAEVLHCHSGNNTPLCAGRVSCIGRPHDWPVKACFNLQ